MENIKNKSVGQIVAEDYRTAKVFEKHQIDFCCNGNKSLAEASAVQNVNLDELINELEEVENTPTNDAADFNSWPLDLLADYIVKTHHKYCEEQIGILKPYLQKLCEVHGDRHPELFEVRDLFGKVSGEIAAHLKKEEIILFPFIKKVVKAQENNEKLSTPISRIENPVNMMIHDHTDQGEAMRKIAALTNEFTLPQDGCNTYQLTLNLLRDFELDLHKHIHLENNILFPKAIELAKEWTTV